ncbi:nuclear hormone receptor FTZ-F1 beta-like [Lingula anatina]|uniref:Nuclear hormone receptor FTZ-F1 beta-like n=1 Tax=Lingula anatina TaxID=7574 RepID=A0A1S3KB96_LINAN|nr:nuclear hormone receptor FTZ-F1 beta-like [Lingula anatina]|eukprot:XP_013419762.1 nuclear hormone receptor FTZ-F1 beta-like [Lingula anatina]
MSEDTDVGISPVLLQAVTEKLATSTNHHINHTDTVITTAAGNLSSDPGGGYMVASSDLLETASHEVGVEGGVQEQIVEEGGHEDGIHERVVYLDHGPEGQEEVIVMDRHENNGVDEVAEQVVETQDGDNQTRIVLEQKSGQRLVIRVEPNGDSGDTQAGVARQQIINVQGDFDVGKVLAAIANHHAKSQGESENQAEAPIILIANSQEEQQLSGGDIPVATTETIVDMAGYEDGSRKRAMYTINQDGTPSKMRIIELSNVASHIINSSSPATAQSPQQSTMAAMLEKYADKGPCPICGDRVSGFHYGIYTCESCKGFFKRTVQNKKDFSCHRNGDCDVNVMNRKKCPSCRFKKCLEGGMRLEAIRVDRTRGGRSSYSSPGSLTSSPSNLQLTPLRTPPNAQTASANPSLVAILNRPLGSTLKSPSAVVPVLPSIVTEIMNVESLLSDEEPVAACCQDRMTASDRDQYNSLLHLADHRLYKIVRWARNLPDFAGIETDDQILMLQNAWSELLLVGCCWRSIGVQNQLLLSNGKLMTLEMARAIEVEETFTRLLNLTQHLRRLKVDKHEYACFKVLVLISPDIDGLKNPTSIREYQDHINEALLTYTSTHFPEMPTKFGELLLRIGELTQTAVIAKEQLVRKHMAGTIPTFSLLTELIKGDSILSAASQL